MKIIHVISNTNAHLPPSLFEDFMARRRLLRSFQLRDLGITTIKTIEKVLAINNKENKTKQSIKIRKPAVKGGTTYE